MLLDATLFSFTAPLEACYDVVRRDFDALSRDDFVRWPVHDAYSGGDWLVFPLVLESMPDNLDFDLEANQRRCSATMQALAELQGVQAAGFSWLEPGCHIHPHEDQYDPGAIRAHLGIRVPGGSAIRIDGEMATWQERRVIVFDGDLLHETANLSAEPRIILLVDFVLTEAECRVVGRPFAARDSRS